ncbi:hypothetical protein CFAM422_012538 [Trichoderma lentiforme]|uniref:Uncharacterized protein n=1 Tax=Trichoderma lentiforme TaxID=1567552 RepID=A0A9P4X4V1_9HYPO|nr:hypothetical protein CFAM422_012538 [Trichoderma lentiforme]
MCNQGSRSSSFFFFFLKLTQSTTFEKLCRVEQPKPFIFSERIVQMPPARPEAPRRRQNQLVDWFWVVVILLSLAYETMNRIMLHRERMANIAVTTITITTIGPTTPCVCPAPTAAAIAAPSDVVAVGAPLVSLPPLEALLLFPVWAPWRRLNNPCALWALGRLGV